MQYGKRFKEQRIGIRFDSKKRRQIYGEIRNPKWKSEFSMHVLRHTYATRAIERGVNPKALQKLLGHASLQVTMDTYVHVTDDSKRLAVRRFEAADTI